MLSSIGSRHLLKLYVFNATECSAKAHNVIEKLIFHTLSVLMSDQSEVNALTAEIRLKVNEFS